MIKADILIIGAGPVGAHAATLFGQSGFKVVVVEKNRKDECGAQWVNGVPLWQLEKAGIAKPSKEQIYHEGGIFSMISPLGSQRISLYDAPLFDLDMRRFGLGLLQSAENQANVTTYFEAWCHGLELDKNDRPYCAATSIGKIEFKLVVDCSGLSAVVRKQIPTLHHLCPVVTKQDLCTAAQEVREVADVHGAQSFLEQNHAVAGEALAWVNVAGGFSLLRVQVDPSLDRVAFLTGARPIPGNLSAIDLIREFRKQHPWVGAKIFGGQRPVPLRRPYVALGASGVALLGDSGCQVYSAHASGIGISLIAASKLARIVSKARDQGKDFGSHETMAAYGREFFLEYGSLLVNSDASRRFSQNLGKEDTHFLIERKLMTRSMILDSLVQKPIQFSLLDLPKQAVSGVQRPKLMHQVLKVAAKMPVIAGLIKSYPRRGVMDIDKMQLFENRLEKIVSF